MIYNFGATYDKTKVVDTFKELIVLELASVLAGPGVGQFFAELGAEVIKVENLRTSGDVTRSWKLKDEKTDDRSAYFCSANWGKQSIAVDLTHVTGRDIVHRLARRADIVIASYKPGDAEKLGVDYASLSALNPRLIYGEISGYGQDNPRVGYDAIIQAEAGFMSMNGEPGGPSLKMPVALVDILAGHQLKEGLLVALMERTRTGAGRRVSVSLIDAAIASLANQATNYLVSSAIPQKQGSAHPNIAPYGDLFRTADDREIILAVGADHQFRQLCSVLEISNLSNDDRFSNNLQRVRNRVALGEILSERVGRHRADRLLAALHAAKIPAAVIRDMQEVFSDPVASRLVLRDGPAAGVRTYVASDGRAISSHLLPPPHLGEHTESILQNVLNFSPVEVKSLMAGRVVG